MGGSSWWTEYAVAMVGSTAIFVSIERAVELGGVDVANAARSASANAMLSVKKRFSLFANSLRV